MAGHQAIALVEFQPVGGDRVGDRGIDPPDALMAAAQQRRLVMPGALGDPGMILHDLRLAARTDHRRQVVGQHTGGPCQDRTRNVGDGAARRPVDQFTNGFGDLGFVVGVAHDIALAKSEAR